MPHSTPHLISRLRRRMRVSAARSRLPEQSAELFLAIIVGVIGAGGAIAFRWSLEFVTALFFGDVAAGMETVAPWHRVLLPAIGALIVGPLIAWAGPDMEGSGVPELQEAVALHGGRIRPLRWLLKAITAALTIGSGGSAGREGPIAFISGTLGADLARLVPGGERRRKLLLACGAAAGVAATFNAPLTGAFYALEIVLGAWGAETFAPVVVSAVISSAIGRHVFGNVPAFVVPRYSLATSYELLAFAVLGLACAFAGTIFTTWLYFVNDLWTRFAWPRALRLLPAALLVGVLGVWLPGVMGLGYDTISSTLQGRLPGIELLLLLALGKIVATSLTLGSGGSGGIFAPSLLVGAMLGGAIGQLMHGLSPAFGTSEGAYALVGMGGLFAATSHAPITSVLTIFELTGDYLMILPLMLVCGIATVVARHIKRPSIFNLKLLRRGVHLELGRDVALLNELKVRDAMTTKLVTIPPDALVGGVLVRARETEHSGYPLVDEAGVLHGIVTIDDLRRAEAEGLLTDPVTALATHRLVVAFPGESLNDALRKLGMHEINLMPVVARDDHTQILGIITHKDIISAYNHALARRHTSLGSTTKSEFFE